MADFAASSSTSALGLGNGLSATSEAATALAIISSFTLQDAVVALAIATGLSVPASNPVFQQSYNSFPAGPVLTLGAASLGGGGGGGGPSTPTTGQIWPRGLC